MLPATVTRLHLDAATFIADLAYDAADTPEEASDAYRQVMTLFVQGKPIPVRLRADLAQDGRVQETLARVAATAHAPFVEAATSRGTDPNKT
jgi:hypothetical protein